MTKKGDFTWVIDPLDGTHNFIAGKPLFGTLISCLKKYSDFRSNRYSYFRSKMDWRKKLV